MGFRDKTRYTAEETLALMKTDIYDDNDARRHAGEKPLNQRSAAEDDIGNTVEISCNDLKMVVRKLRNVARNIPSAYNACVEMAGDIEDVINLLEGNAQHP